MYNLIYKDLSSKVGPYFMLESLLCGYIGKKEGKYVLYILKRTSAVASVVGTSIKGAVNVDSHGRYWITYPLPGGTRFDTICVDRSKLIVEENNENFRTT